MGDDAQRTGGAALTVVVGVAVAALAAIAAWTLAVRPGIEFTTPYQVVLLTNGQPYIGKLAKPESPYPMLTDVYYVQSQVNPDTKQVTNTLIKRGNEWHAPDRMILNRDHILFIEPVKPDSQVGKLIAETAASDQKK